MNALAGCINPSTVIFTNVGEAHAEGFASAEEKAKEKALLAAPHTVKRIIFNADCIPLRNALKALYRGAGIIGMVAYRQFCSSLRQRHRVVRQRDHGSGIYF